tara:strand:- start:11742 stop:14144 length:2403 start_codon:yes stop_codon:yes gene_type:complete
MIKDTTKHIASFALVMLLTVGFAVSAHAQNTLYGDNVVIDGDFPGDTLTSVWNVEGTIGTASIIDGALAFTNMAETANIYDFQVNQPFSAEQLAELEKGGTFEVTFDARTTADTKNFHLFLGQVGGDWARYFAADGDGLVTVTNEMQSYRLTTDIKETWPEMRLGFEVSSDTSSLFLDNIVLRKVDDNLLYDGGLVIGEDSLSTKWLQVIGSASATFTADNGAVKISEMANLVNSYDIQWYQDLDTAQVDSIYPGPYIMSFDAKTVADSKQIQVFFGNNGTDGDWTNFAPTVELTNTWKTYSLNIDASQNWSQMKIGFEVSADTSSLWLDNVVVSRVREITPNAPSFSLSSEDEVVTITVSPEAGAATYNVYFNDTAIDSLGQPGSALVGTLNAETGLSMTHSTSAPHVTLANTFTANYAVTAITANGTASELSANQTVEAGMSVNPNQGVELASASVDVVFDAIQAKSIPDAATIAGFFPAGYVPFVINEETRVRENGAGGDDDADISAKFWVGTDTFDDYLIIYAEITDDVVVPATQATGGGGAWNFDSWEGGISNYSPASFIQGSTHDAFEGGAEPDYQLRAGLSADGDPFVHMNNSATGFDGPVPNSGTVGEETDYGYRILSYYSTFDFTVSDAEAKFDFPSGNEVKVYPFQIGVNDNDATSRDAQFTYSPKGGQDDWWNTPARWASIAFVGIDAYVVSNEEENSKELNTFKLDQNYPNPFNPTTNIKFSLANTSDVTLEVFNMLGQKVATLLQNEKMTSGQHSQAFDASSLASGMYVYRLSTPSFVQSRKMMLIK